MGRSLSGYARVNAFAEDMSCQAPRCQATLRANCIAALIVDTVRDEEVQPMKKIQFRVVPLFALACVWMACGAKSRSPDEMTTPRFNHSATLLLNGTVLLAGGESGIYTAELYDPATNTFGSSFNMVSGRYLHTATLLADGSVLLAGGNNNGKAELFNPDSHSFRATGSMMSGRFLHTATLLPNGNVLVTGGIRVDQVVATAELYDPATGIFTSTSSMLTQRALHTATLLPDGNVLIAGGSSDTDTALASAELYNPQTGTFTMTGAMGMERADHTATLLATGQVLVAGGLGFAGGFLNSAELYDPATGSFRATGTMTSARDLHTETLLSNGKVLLTGGYGPDGLGHIVTFSSAELYDPRAGSFTATNDMNTTRRLHTATRLPDGRVLLAGGLDATGTALTTAEVFVQP